MSDDTTIERFSPAMGTLMQERLPASTASRVRIVMATNVLESGDAAFNLMRRLIRAHRAEVIYLGHLRVHDLVRAAVQEDADAIMLSIQDRAGVGYCCHLAEMLRASGMGQVLVFVRMPHALSAHESLELEASGVTRVYRAAAISDAELAQMMADIATRASSIVRRHPVQPSPQETGYAWWPKPPSTPAPPPVSPEPEQGDPAFKQERAIARMLSLVEEKFYPSSPFYGLRKYRPLVPGAVPVIGITGSGGAGKSAVMDELLTRFLACFPEMRIAVIAVVPSRRRSGGALLDDRQRMNALRSPRVYMRSMAARRQHLSTSAALQECIQYLTTEDFDLVMVETAGIGQGDSSIVDLVDLPIYVMTGDYGAGSQLEKIDMLDYADLVVLNKYDQRGADAALDDVRQHWCQNHAEHDLAGDDIPVYPTIASQFNDPGLDSMFIHLCRRVRERMRESFPQTPANIGLQTGVEISSGTYALNLMPMRCDFNPVLDVKDQSPHVTRLTPAHRGCCKTHFLAQAKAPVFSHPNRADDLKKALQW